MAEPFSSEAQQAPKSYVDRKVREAEERGDFADAAQWRRIQADVELAPPLTQAQKDRLRILLAPTARRLARTA